MPIGAIETTRSQRGLLGAIHQFEKTSLIAKLKSARDRKKAATGKCGGRKSYAEARPEVVSAAKELRDEQCSLRQISALLAEQGYVTANGKPYVAPKAHNVTRYDRMIIVGPIGPSARALPWLFVVPGACAVAPFIRPRFGTAPVEWHLAIVDPLLVARLDAKSLLGSAGRLVVAPYAVGKRCHARSGPCNSTVIAGR
jgi:hypothetical protein